MGLLLICTMHIHSNYLNYLNSFTELDDEQFLAFHIWQMIHCRPYEMSLIKNTSCEFIAFTQKMQTEFNLPLGILGKTFQQMGLVAPNISQDIHRQELNLINTKTQQNSFYFYKNQAGITNSYLVKKQPLINPNSDNVVGILINTERVRPNLMRSFLLKQHNSATQHTPLITKDFTYIQKQIILCLIIGISGRKEISQTLSKLLNEDITEIKIKNSLQQLYKDFHCSDSQQLVNTILTNRTYSELLEYPVIPGNYLLDN